MRRRDRAPGPFGASAATSAIALVSHPVIVVVAALTPVIGFTIFAQSSLIVCLCCLVESSVVTELEVGRRQAERGRKERADDMPVNFALHGA